MYLFIFVIDFSLTLNSDIIEGALCSSREKKSL